MRGVRHLLLSLADQLGYSTIHEHHFIDPLMPHASDHLLASATLLWEAVSCNRSPQHSSFLADRDARFCECRDKTGHFICFSIHNRGKYAKKLVGRATRSSDKNRTSCEQLRRAASFVKLSMIDTRSANRTSRSCKRGRRVIQPTR